MAALILDILWRIVAWGLALAGFLVILHALLGDWLGGVRHAARVRRAARSDVSIPTRRRCPGGWSRLLWLVPIRTGCWYDMSAAEPDEDGRLLCPECGRRSRPRHLLASRRNWLLALAGVLIIALGLGGRYAREVYRRGWSAIPDEVLVLVPFDERAWIEGGSTGSHTLIEDAADELARRDRLGSLSPWASDRLGRRVQARYRRDPDYGASAQALDALERLETTPFPGGLERVTLTDAVMRIAGAAGLPIQIDHESLRSAHIDPDRPMTVPAFTSMTCAQALHWACDRARASRGWGVAAWDLREQTIVVSSDAALALSKRVQVLTIRPSIESRVLAARTDPLWLDPRSIVVRGDAHVITATTRQVAQAVRRDEQRRAGAGLSEARPDRIAALQARIDAPLRVSLEPGDTLLTIVGRLRSDLGMPVGVDWWGLDPYKPLAEPGGGSNSAFSSSPGASWGNDAQRATDLPGTLAEALDRLGAEVVHDGDSIVIGLRACQLLSSHAAFVLPEPRPRVGVRLAPVPRNTLSSHPQAFVVVEDRLVLIGPPDALARAAPIVEQWIADWKAELGRPDTR